MFSTSILDVAVGLIFVYVLLSLVCTAAKETIEGWFKRRAKDLEAGIRELLDDPNGTGLAKKVYEHPLIFGLFPGGYKPGVSLAASLKSLGRTNLPSYIPARNFALALVDTVIHPQASAGADASAGVAPAPLKEALERLPDGQVRRALLALARVAQDDPTRFRENVETWFNSAMDRLSGAYKRKSNVVVLLIGLAVTVGLNADTIVMFRSLSEDPQARERLVVAAGTYTAAQVVSKDAPEAAKEEAPVLTQDGLKTLKVRLTQVGALGLPIGWNSEDPRTACPRQWRDWMRRVVGWLLTALAISLGAPFWFDLLNKVILIRASLKPDETATSQDRRRLAERRGQQAEATAPVGGGGGAQGTGQPVSG